MTEVPPSVIDYLDSQRCLTLATASNEGEPNAATLLYVNDGVELFVWFGSSSKSLARVEENPRVSFAIDEYADDFSQTKGVQGRGRCEPVTGDDVARAAMMFGDRFPQIEPSGSTASIVFYRIRPTELLFIDNTGKDRRKHEFGFDFHRDRVLGDG